MASALDFAHEQGVIHRDIKPENILLQDGIAMLADFGIALAVKEAGGQRLTETGMYLGTPQYMSPEQAMGERALDARSDVYSLAAVLYEMLAGDPPHVGSTAQAVIAKLVVERPTKLRVLRQTVPVGVEEAVAQGLAKMPADRYATAGEFARALAAGAAGKRPLHRRVLARRIGIAVLGLATVIGGSVALARRGRFAGGRVPVTLRDRTRLTNTGDARAPTISSDGKQLAYGTTQCGAAGCTQSVEIQNVGESESRRVLEGQRGAEPLAWSPDRRDLLVSATVNGREGQYLVSTSGTAPRFLFQWGAADFFAQGDSLLIMPYGRADSMIWIRVAGRNGVVVDSIPTRIAQQDCCCLWAVPRTSWIITCAVTHLDSGRENMEWRVLDRHGRESDRKVLMIGNARASTNALWIYRSRGDGAPTLVRVPFDSSTGRLAPTMDTVYSGEVTGFNVTADGATLVIDEGVEAFEVYALALPELLRGAFTANRSLMRSSVRMQAAVSPNGSKVVISQPGGAAGSSRLSILPFGGGTASTISLPFPVWFVGWVDTVTLSFIFAKSDQRGFARLDARSGAVTAEWYSPDLRMEDYTSLPMEAGRGSRSNGPGLRVHRAGDSTIRTIATPPWNKYIWNVNVDSAGTRVVVSGPNRAMDSIAIGVLPLSGGAPVPWATFLGTYGGAIFLNNGSVVCMITEYYGSETRELYRIRAPGKVERLGATRRRLTSWGFTPDLRRAVVTVNDRRAGIRGCGGW